MAQLLGIVTGVLLFGGIAVMIGLSAFVNRASDPPVPPAPPAEPERPLTAQEVAALKAADPCIFCGGIHFGLCRRVQEIWYFPDGRVRHAILKDTWSIERTIFPDELPDEG